MLSLTSGKVTISSSNSFRIVVSVLIISDAQSGNLQAMYDSVIETFVVKVKI